MLHIIHKLAFDTVCTREQQALAVRQKLQKDFYNEILVAIGDSCDRLSTEQESIRIDKLEINLKISGNDILNKEQFLQSFEKEFTFQLQKKIANQAHKQNLQQSYREALFHFLENGTLPWWIKENDADLDKWAEEIMNNAEASDLILWLIQHKNARQIWQRITYQFSGIFKNFIVDKINELSDARERMISLYNTMRNSSGTDSNYMIIDIDRINHFLVAEAPGILNDQSIEVKDLLDTFLMEIVKDDKMGKLPVVAGNDTLSPTKMNQQPKSYFNNNMIEDEEKITVSNAGIILLAAYLKDFFQNTGLWKGAEWASDFSSHKAVMVLHYAATGDEQAYEYELILEKILCGLPLETPVEREIILNNSEKQECIYLLNSIIEHWPALKNTSMDGLRKAFLQRDGLLSKKKDAWFLQIERKTMDILLEQIPWGYATVSLPWNPYLIFTEW